VDYGWKESFHPPFHLPPNSLLAGKTRRFFRQPDGESPGWFHGFFAEVVEEC
jgi:hypothetical protein